jgi:hypothetical protein
VPPYRIEVDEARGIIVAVATGRVEQALAMQMVGEARRLAMERELHILYDLRDAEPGDMSSGALFWMPRQMSVLQGVQARRVRVALLHPAEYAAMAAYWETAFGNAGLRVRAFTEEEGAVAWLMAPEAKG